MNRSYYETPKPSKMMQLFWKIAGADRYLLEKATYQDQIKYFCLGGIILATGVMAALAGGYAFYTIFEPRDLIYAKENNTHIPTAIMSFFFGIIWGAVIFNIDRFIVTSTGKGDGTEKITWDELKGAIPRIVMGLVIAVTISKPVEIRMFKTEIDTKLHERQLVIQKDYEIKTRKTFEERINDIDKDNIEIQATRKDFQQKINTKDSLYNVETSSGQSGRIKGEGAVAKAYKNERENLKIDLSQFEKQNLSKIQDIDTRKKELYAELNLALSKDKDVAKGLNGLLARIQIAHELDWKITLFITLLFIVIELTPIFFKLMLIKTPYDYMEENIKELIKAENGIEVKYNYYADDKSKEGMERHLVINHNVEKEIFQTSRATEVQKELIDYAINKYKEQMKAKIDANPEDFIKEEDLNNINPNKV